MDQRVSAIEKYGAAIRGVAEYAPKLCDAADQGDSPERGYLRAMAGEVLEGDRTVLEESRSYLRCILREYRDESARYLADLRQDLAATAGTLRDVTRALAASDSDGGAGVEGALAQLKESTRRTAAPKASAFLREIADELGKGLADMRKHHQLIVSHLHTEVRILQRRMESLTAADLDDLSKLMPRDEIEDRIAVAAAGTFRLLLLKVDGLLRARGRHPAQVFNDLSTAFIRRMRNNLPADAPVGRWSEEGFVAMVFAGTGHTRELAETLRSRLSGPYICRSGAKTVITTLQVRVEVLERRGDQGRDAIIEALDRLL
jgi:GGDEF domain-containing protein